MLLCLKCQDIFFHKDGKIVTFERQEEAQHYLNLFQQYAVNKLIQETQNLAAPLQVQATLSQVELIPIDFECECGFISYRELGL